MLHVCYTLYASLRCAPLPCAVPRKKAQTFHGKYNLTQLHATTTPTVTRIYTTENLKQQGGWVNKSSLPNQKIFKFQYITLYPYICDNFFFRLRATIGSYI